MARRRTLGVATAVGALASAGLVASAAGPAAAFGYSQLTPQQKLHVSGALTDALGPTGPATDAPAGASPVTPGPNYTPTGAGTCPVTFGSNIKVNQNCENVSAADLQGRAQAQNETWIASDPSNPSHLLASYNDYRRGDGTCGTSSSADGGQTWADSTVPNGFTRGFAGYAREYWEAGGDTSVAYDSRGNAYLSCQVFGRGAPTTQNVDQSSGFLLFRSTGNNGASWSFPGTPAALFNDTAGSGSTLLDKQLLAVDASVTSPYRDRIYITYTDFAANGTAYIYEVHSADYGRTFSRPTLVSQKSVLCPKPAGPTPLGNCNSNQFSQPFTAPDGTLYVVWSNFNNATAPANGGDGGNPGDLKTGAPNPNANYNQVLLARSTDGGSTFGTPIRVGTYYDLPSCQTYTGHDPFRGCVPTSGAAPGPNQTSYFRATNYAYGAVDPVDPSKVVVAYGSYINRDSNESTGCAPAGLASDGTNLYTGVGAGCNNDILISTSTDAAHSFTGTHTGPRSMPVATTAPGQATTDQFWPGVTFTPSGVLGVAYYDRQYGSDQASGYSDVSLSTSPDATTFSVTRLTMSSMPPPTQFSGLFYGDYIQIAAAGETIHSTWSDTRDPEYFTCPATGRPQLCLGPAPNAPVANDQDVFTAATAAGTAAR